MRISPTILIATMVAVLGFSFTSNATLYAQLTFQEDSYSRQYTAMQKELAPDKLSAEDLIKMLAEPRFYAREVASKELQLRGHKNFDLLLSAKDSDDAERRQRAEAILHAISKDLTTLLAAKAKPVFKAEVSNPRFWTGPNRTLGIEQDFSFDCNVILTADYPFSNILTPLPVLSAVSNTGENITRQVWCSNLDSSSSPPLFFRQPNRYFDTIHAEIEIRCDVFLGESARFSLEPRRHVVRKDLCWITIEKKMGILTEGISYKVTMIDYLGRLELMQNFELINAAGEVCTAEFSSSSGEFFRSWKITVDPTKSFPTDLKIKMGGLKIPYRGKQKVTVENPNPVPKRNPFPG